MRGPAAGRAHPAPPRGLAPRDTPTGPRPERPPAPAPRPPQIDVDVFREVRAVRDVPLNGAKSFFEEQVAAWAELCLAPDWAEAAQLLAPMCRSMPLLLHHRDDIFEVIAARLTLSAKVSPRAAPAPRGAPPP